MRFTLLVSALLLSGGVAALAQDHGAITLNGQIVQLTGYRTRTSENKRWVIADGKKDGKLYSLTVTMKPDVAKEGPVKTDATHTVTITVSKADYSDAQNYCFDGGSLITLVPRNGQYTISGKDMQPGNCYGKSQAGNKLTFTMKP